jgi:hypothetical protein
MYGGGNGDGFLAAFSADLQKLFDSPYFGGTDRELVEGLAISRKTLPGKSGAGRPVEARVAGKIVNTMLFWNPSGFGLPRRRVATMFVDWQSEPCQETGEGPGNSGAPAGVECAAQIG